jgi:hypothetical protein
MRAQSRFMRLIEHHRLLAFVARRQYGKTTTFAKVALKKMMKQRDHTVIFGSAKLSLSREIVRKESEILRAALGKLGTAAAAEKGSLLVADAQTQQIPDRLTGDDFAHLFEAQRLEFRYYHNRHSYSRTKVVALLPDTVGETGDLLADEVGRVKRFREVWEAIEPIVARNPQFRLCLSTTPPPDDTHFSFEMLAPPVGAKFTACPEGNLYESTMGVTVLRVDAWDAAADGLPIYDIRTGEPLTPEESRRRSHDKDAWDRNFGCLFLIGGTSACGLIQLDTAQNRGIGRCAHIPIETDADLDTAVAHLHGHLGSGKVGIGFDIATTEKGVSNPTAVSVVERVGAEYIVPLVVTWKTADPEVAEERIRRIIAAVAARKEGGRARGLAIDATNERYFASRLRSSLRSQLPCRLVVGSETIERAGYEPMTMKQFLGAILVGELDDNHLTLPPERYIRDDWRLVKKERGMFVCEPDVDGKHGDTFDSTKLAIHCIASGGGVLEAEAIAVGSQPPDSSGTARMRLRMRPGNDTDPVPTLSI